MRILLTAAALAIAATLSADPASAASTQQAKMTACNSEASTKKLTGDARKSFMSSCLSGTSAQPAAASKAHTCATQADAKKLSGAARTSFVNKCAAG
jgi:hypothetical protein